MQKELRISSPSSSIRFALNRLLKKPLEPDSDEPIQTRIQEKMNNEKENYVRMYVHTT